MKSGELRHRAELRLRGRPLESTSTDPALLVYELSVREAELEVQNEELDRIENELRETKDHYFTFFKNAPAGHLVLAEDGSIVETNPAAANMLGGAMESLVGRPFTDVLSGGDVDRFREHVRRVIEQREKGELLLRVHRTDGSSVPVLFASVAFGAASCLVSMTDLSPLDREEVRDESARFQQIAKHIEDVFFILDLSTRRALYVSPAFDRVFGRPTSDALDPKCDPIPWVHPDDRWAVSRALVAFSRGDPLDVEFRILHPTSAVRTLRARAFPVADGTNVVGVINDVTEERALEEELRQAHKLDAVGALASGMAHDFNNMLMGIIGFATIALTRIEPNHPAHPILKRIVDVAGRGKTLTRQLLDFSRRRAPERTPIELDLAIADCIPLLQTLVGEHIVLTVQRDTLGCRVIADAGEIEQILMNLATNARDSMPKGGTLDVSTKEVVIRSHEISGLPAGRYAALTVRDTGCGMDETTLARVFEPFFTTKQGGRGTGLGLSNACTLVKRMGGRVSVASKLGAGTAFTIFLPVVLDTSEIELPQLPGREANILVVEDDAVVRTTVAHYVANLGYRPIVAATPAEAKRIAAELGKRLDVLLTDIMMPQQLGRDLAHSICRLSSNVRVIYMSAHDRDELIETERIEPSALLLQKPFSERRLGLILQQLLSSSS